MFLALPVVSALLGIGAFSALPYAWVLALAWLVPLFLFFQRECRLVRLLIGTALFRIIFAAGVVYFAAEPFGWMASILLFLGLPVSFHLVRRFVGARAAAISLPFLWTFWDLLEARYTFLPVYVMAQGNALAVSPFLGLARWGGIAGLTLFGAVVNAVLTGGIITLFKRERHLWIGAIVLLLVAGFSASRWVLHQNGAAYQSRPRELRVAAVSTDAVFDSALNFPYDILSPSERQIAAEHLAAMLEPLRHELRRQPLDLVLLPEDMIDLESWHDADPEALAAFGIESGGVLIAAYRRLAADLAVDVSATFTTIQRGERYNTTLLFSRDGALAGRANKVRLAIGGEYWPFGRWRPFYWNWAGRIRPEISAESPIFDPQYQYAAGEPHLLHTGGFSFASPICAEVHYPWDIRAAVQEGAQFVVHTGNNSWVALGRGQYLRLTDGVRRTEAVWLNVPIVITGKDERAGVLAPDGRLDAVSVDPMRHYGIFFNTLRL